VVFLALNTNSLITGFSQYCHHK